MIGYTGQGAEQYWTTQLFNEIKPGDLLGFHEEIIRQTQNLKEKDFHQYHKDEKLHALSLLINEYSRISEAKSAGSFLDIISGLI